MPVFTFSVHAIERYQQRIHPNLTSEQAEERLVDLSKAAILSSYRTHRGQACWVIEDAVLVAKSDRSTHVIVTILHPSYVPALFPARQGSRVASDWSDFLQERYNLF